MTSIPYSRFWQPLQFGQGTFGLCSVAMSNASFQSSLSARGFLIPSGKTRKEIDATPFAKFWPRQFAFDESEHPRGQPENAGQFTEKTETEKIKDEFQELRRKRNLEQKQSPEPEKPTAGTRDKFADIPSIDANADIREALQQAKDIGNVKQFGMPKPEKMKAIKIGETPLAWSDGRSAAAADIAMRITEIPEKLRNSIRAIVLSSQQAETAHVEGKTLATSKSGRMVIYGTSELADFDTIVHESAHSFARAKWGSGTGAPKKGSQYWKAQQQEKPVTKYGATHPSEDFAEAVMMYAKSQDWLKQNFPLKFAAITELLK